MLSPVNLMHRSPVFVPALAQMVEISLIYDGLVAVMDS